MNYFVLYDETSPSLTIVRSKSEPVKSTPQGRNIYPARDREIIFQIHQYLDLDPKWSDTWVQISREEMITFIDAMRDTVEHLLFEEMSTICDQFSMLETIQDK